MADLKLGIVVDTDTRPTRQEFSTLRREIKREAENMEGDWERAGEKIEDALREAGARDDLIEAARRIGREGPSELEKMQRALRDTGDDARTLGDDMRDAAEGIRESFEDNALTADDVLGAEVRAEILSNAAESGAEIARGLKDGFDSEDMETIVDGITDTIVSVGAVGGPVGVAAGLAGASVVQMLAGPLIEGAQQKAEQFEETFTAAFDNIVQAGAEMGAELTISNTVTQLTQDTDRLAEATEVAKGLGVDIGIVLRAMAGDMDAYNVVAGAAAPLQQDLADKMDAVRESTGATRAEQEAAGRALQDLSNEEAALSLLLGDVTTQYETNTEAISAAKAATDAKAAADAYAAQKASEQALAMARSTGQAQDFTVVVDGATRALRALPEGKVVEVTDDGTVREVQDAINGIHGTSVRASVFFDRDDMQRSLDAAARSLRAPVTSVRVRMGQEVA